MCRLNFVSSAAYGGEKKSKFLAAYPMVFKFLLFWWCVFVFAVMTVYIADHLLYRKFGPAKVAWRAEHIFRGVSRDDLWAQLADPSKWSCDHPVLQTADVSLVSDIAEPKKTDEDSTSDKVDEEVVSDKSAEERPFENPKKQFETRKLGQLKKGHGMILRHKAESGPQAGTFFCVRECSQIEEPADGPYLLVMRTVEAGLGYPFLENTEVSEVEIFPAEETVLSAAN
ncbi:unnamed protein product [Effrenium voratum]|nr:unnamed protein product [Effrenium voratum]